MKSTTRLLTAGAVIAAMLVAPSATGTAQAATFRYGEALQKSFLFYEAQASGRLPDWNRVSWRDDSTLNDGRAAGVDLSGGWYDAGDHVKFGFPMAAAVTTLAWGGVDHRAAYSKAGQLTHLLNNLRQANDYFIAAHPEPNTLYVQVGDGGEDHSYWGAPETVDAKGHTRPAYKITASCPGTDVAAETASAMAASSMVFRATNPAYADTLLTHARQLYTFADTTKGTTGQDTAYVRCVPAAQGFYNSTGEGGQVEGATKMYWDELAWASIWLHRATGQASYLDKAREFYPKMGSQDDPGNQGVKVPVFNFGYGWNDKQYAVYMMMAKLTGEQKYKDDTQRYLDYWTVGYKGKKGTITPGGLAFIFFWASLRMAANTAWVALNYADYLGSDDPLYARYHDFGKRQIDYALGDNPRNSSYMVGFGANPPRNVHHRGAHGSWTNAGPDSEPATSRHILFGALAGGPDAGDTYTDSRGDYVKNEVALDFNSGITSSLVRLYDEYGGEPLASIPQETPDGNEYSIEATINHQARETMARTYIINKSAWPARVLDKAKIRYYFTLDGNTTPSQVTVGASYTQCKPPTGPHQLEGRIYYAEADCTGTLIFPGGQSEYRREVQLRIGVAEGATWDPTNDWSASGGQNITYYGNDGTLLWGRPPVPDTPDTQPPTRPGTPVASGVTATGATLTWAAATDDRGVQGYDVYRTGSMTKAGSTTTTSITLTGLTPDTEYSYYVVARDSVNTGPQSDPVTFTTDPAPDDDEDPTVPGKPVISAITRTGATVTWTASSDNVGVTGYDVVSPSGTVLGSSTGTSLVLTGLTAATDYSVAVVAKDEAGNRSDPSPPTAFRTESESTGTCRVTYSTSDWDTGFTAAVGITNTGTTPINGWTLRFSFTAGQRVTPPGWSAAWTQSGADVTATHLDWSRTINPGQTITMGFNGSHTGSNPRPPSFTLNGATCV